MKKNVKKVMSLAAAGILAAGVLTDAAVQIQQIHLKQRRQGMGQRRRMELPVKKRP